MATKKAATPEVEIEVIRYNEYNARKKSNLLGFATVKVNGVVITGIKHMEGKKGNFIDMPSIKGSGKNDDYYPTVWIDLGDKDTNRTVYAQIAEAVDDFAESAE